MRNLNTICKDGTNLESSKDCVAGFAFQSLRMGLKAYFSTYEEMKHSLHLFEDSRSSTNEEKDLNTPLAFFELSAETILHFHHFTELILKDLLRSEHTLLADMGSRKAVVLKKLLDRQPLTQEEENGIQSIEFSEALTRIVALINADDITEAMNLQFIVGSQDFLKRLNKLRNRIWHRGTFILRYDALDEFVCFHFLPFMSKILSLNKYSEQASSWKYKNLDCGFDPLDFLLSECRTYDISKFAFVKELGRAAYNNQLLTDNLFLRFLNDEVKRRAIAAAQSENCNVAQIINCPVCGVESLVVYDDIETEGEDHETGHYERAWRYTWQVKCHCCSFEINHHLKNGSEYGIPIEDYWESEYI